MELIYESLKMMGIGIGIFIYAIFLLRLAKSRIQLKTPFDFVIIILIGSLLSRAINGSAALIPTLLTTFLLTTFHWFLSWVTYNYEIGRIVKGKAKLLISNGEINWSQMKKSKITQEDLLEAARKNHISDIKSIKSAYMERDGHISFIKK